MHEIDAHVPNICGMPSPVPKKCILVFTFKINELNFLPNVNHIEQKHIYTAVCKKFNAMKELSEFREI